VIEPESIPLFTGDLGQLDHHVEALRREAVGIRDAGATAHSQFQGLSAFYEAPEAEDLFASPAPARDAADTFADKVETVAEALSTYAAEVAPIAKRLEELKIRTSAFVAGLRTESGEFDEKWNKDAEKVEEHHALWHEVHAAQQAFWEAEVACANRITALVGGTQYVLNTGDKQLVPRGAHLYGYSAEVLDQAKELPWGTPVTQHHDWWDPRDFGHYFKSFVWDGLIVDNVWGTVDGLFSLTGINGAQEFKDSWTGLARVLVGAETYLMEGASGKKATTGPFATDFAQGSKVYAKEFAKGLVAWDQWEENPSRAAATVVFNTVTLGAGPLKAASAGRAGAAAKAATTVAKIGDALDPLSAAAKVTGHAVPRIAEVTANLRGVGDLAEVRGPHSVLELADGSRLVIEDGRFIAYDKQGNLVDDLPAQERLVAESPHQQLSREGELAGVGAGSRGSAAAGGGTRPGAGHEASLSSGTGGQSTGAADGVGEGGRSGSPVGSGETATDAFGDGAHQSGQRGPGAERPSFMGEGDNPYGPPGSLTPEQIKEIQVYRANHEPGYFEKYYRNNGRRLNTKTLDESGFPPVQLDVDPVTKVKTAASDAPPPIPEKYVPGGEVKRGRRDVLDQETLRHLDEAAAHRRSSIDYSESANRHRELTQGSADEAEIADVGNEYGAAMNERTKASETFGEEIAERQVIPELYGKATKETLYGPANGNYRFDQVWRLNDGRFVVVEAKSSVETRLGKRDLLPQQGAAGTPLDDGRTSAMQGSREYFIDTLTRMRLRGRQYPSERRLANELTAALAQGKLEYILVKGKADGARYAGYEMYKFDIG
jgi:hypothetical protein